MRIILSILFTCFVLSAGGQTKVPSIVLSNPDGLEVNLKSLSNEEKPLVVLFWATWCNPCLEELENVSDLLPEWQEECDFNIVAISIDDSRSSSKIKSFVAGKQWEFNILLDPNQEAKRSLNVTEIPHYIVFDTEGRLRKGHSGYFPGDEEVLFEEILTVCNNDK